MRSAKINNTFDRRKRTKLIEKKTVENEYNALRYRILYVMIIFFIYQIIKN